MAFCCTNIGTSSYIGKRSTVLTFSRFTAFSAQPVAQGCTRIQCFACAFLFVLPHLLTSVTSRGDSCLSYAGYIEPLVFMCGSNPRRKKNPSKIYQMIRSTESHMKSFKISEKSSTNTIYDFSDFLLQILI